MRPKALILAGGFGTRLQSVVNDVPKSLASINGKPFIFYVLDHIDKHGLVDEVILSVGYKSELIIAAVGDQYKSLRISYSVETKPLGTGGAIRFALQDRSFDDMIAMNGDTLALCDLKGFVKSHAGHKGISILARRMTNFDRYGSLTINTQGEVVSFNEKKFTEEGFISCGAYVFSRELFDNVFRPFPRESFSIEKDIMEGQGRIFPIKAFIDDFYFIDIGIPEDYARAQVEFAGF